MQASVWVVYFWVRLMKATSCIVVLACCGKVSHWTANPSLFANLIGSVCVCVCAFVFVCARTACGVLRIYKLISLSYRDYNIFVFIRNEKKLSWKKLTSQPYLYRFWTAVICGAGTLSEFDWKVTFEESIFQHLN